MLDLEHVELHDARVKKMEIDFISKAIKIDLDFYKDIESTSRQSKSIIFEGVEAISQISDLNRLSQNFIPGNVNSWTPIQNEGITYFYLTDGCIAITATKMIIL